MIRSLQWAASAALFLAMHGGEADAHRYLDSPPPRGAPRSPEEVKLRDVRRSDYNSYDEWKVAQLGPNWAKMVRPRDAQIDPYPACKQWKTWIDQYGHRVSGWDWSELNCPWRKRRNCDDD